MSLTQQRPEELDLKQSENRFMVVIYNNDSNSLEEVVDVLMLATRCSTNEAEMETWEAHHLGKAPCHFAPKKECEEVARIISAIGVRTEVRPEWN